MRATDSWRKCERDTCVGGAGGGHGERGKDRRRRKTHRMRERGWEKGEGVSYQYTFMQC